MSKSNVKIPGPKSKFLRVKCGSCKNEQVVFGAAASNVKCLVCNHKLADTGASKINLQAKVVKVLD